MNKGLFIHLMVTGLIIIMWLFVMWDEPILIKHRAGLCLFITLSNVSVCLFLAMQTNEASPYNQKIKL